MTDYTPELGQMVFGQPHKQYEVSEIVQAALRAISVELDRVMWNLHQEHYASPFDNTGNVFVCPVFEAHAYSWGDDEQPYNFKWGDVLIGWYKWSGRGTSSNVEITPDMAAKMLDECLAAVREHESSAVRGG